MGVMNGALGMLFSGGPTAIREAAEVFRVNAEAADMRDLELRRAVLEEFAHEFAQPRATLFDRLIDGANRLPRPLMALGTVGLAISAMVDPVWFAARMQGMALVPEPLWWLMGAIISFYFGARYQAKGQDFQRSIAGTMAMAPVVARNLQQLRALSDAAPAVPDGPQDSGTVPRSQGPNPALDDWRAGL
ncbi:holin family protein [Rhodovulum sulfidophilum]|uniref:holin family protein n=1 Tax=Rhodovulum sulfidophilum TaxID=35806 RepID=UPI00138964EE|nr:holin family protein [Rhodovulum sulfidophilum]NDK34719.1 carboxylesterase [Rhodovulum sulfidophilum]